MSKRNKSKKRLEQSRKRGLLKLRIRINTKRQARIAQEIERAQKGYEDSMITLWRDASPEERIKLEALFLKTAGYSLKAACEARIIAWLQSHAHAAAVI